MDITKQIIVILFLQAAVVDGRMCPGTLDVLSNGTRTEREGAIYDSVRYGHYTELDCCSGEVGDIIHNWRKWNKTTEQWQNYDPDRIGISFYDNKQILAIQSSTFDDDGFYQCSAKSDSSVVKVTNFHLDVIACDKLARGPYPVSPLSCQQTVSRVEETLILPCTGYFGCGEDGDIRIVTWFVSRDKNKTDDWVEATSVDTRYKQINFQRDGGVVKGANLTILGVTDADFNRKFMCLLASPQMVQGQTKMFVTLKKDTSSVFMASFKFVNIVVVVSIVAFISLVFNVLISVITIYEKIHKSDKSVKRSSRQKWMSVESGNAENV